MAKRTTKPSYADPYEGNILTAGLGPILSRQQWVARLTELPKLPDGLASMPPSYRLHHTLDIRDFHIPSLEGIRLAETLDLMLRQSYRYRDPAQASTWAIVGNDSLAPAAPKRAPAMASLVVGLSGVGKTEAIQRALSCYPGQMILHESFPRLLGEHFQLVWLSVDVPPSGRLGDLAANLMIAWDDAVQKHAPQFPRRFEGALSRDRRGGARMIDEWRQVASAHFLGVLHLDEVQNFFKLPTVKSRRSGASQGTTEDPELRLVEDQTLRTVLTLTNTWQIPLVLSGTPDGVAALTKRFSTTQRFVTQGFHRLEGFTAPDAPTFRIFMDQLGRYQYLRQRLQVTDELRRLVFECTAGIPRIIIALWVAAHRVALDREADVLRLDDFRRACDTSLALLKPAVEALKSRDPQRLRHYEDMMLRGHEYWSVFWSSGNILPYDVQTS